MLCGTAGLADDTKWSFARGYEQLQEYRRPDGSIRFDPDPATVWDSIHALEHLLNQHKLSGLFIGHCGWGDLTARLRGKQLADGVKLMILGADWYPLTQCANFLVDRYRMPDITFGRFFAKLRGVLKPTEEEIAKFFRQHRVYLGNTLLCYRTGWETKGETNLSKYSFHNCVVHLERHIDALQPEIIVTFGKNAASSSAKVLKGDEP